MKTVNGGTPVLPFGWTSQPTPNLSGSAIAAPSVIGTHIFTITCTGTGGTVSKSTTISVVDAGGNSGGLIATLTLSG